jgi:hypothetical protein
MPEMRLSTKSIAYQNKSRHGHAECKVFRQVDELLLVKKGTGISPRGSESTHWGGIFLAKFATSQDTSATNHKREVSK